MESVLYVVATPIGNLADISGRAIEVLRQVELIAAEDTRHSRKLLQLHAIRTRVIAYHDHSDERAVRRVCECLAAGGSVALVSDAGTPLISDPGYKLVRAVQDAGFPVRAVPGACAAIAALSISGLATDRFRFEGFLPARPAPRVARLEALSGETATLVFYEAPHRLLDTLQAMLDVFGAREAVLAREITKAFETVRRDSLEGLLAFAAGDSHQQKGEIVLLVAGAREQETGLTPEILRLLQRLARELPAKTAAAVVAEHTGLRRKVLYDRLLALKGERPADGPGGESADH